MAEIVVTSLGDRAFEVQVHDGSLDTTHRVTVPERLAGALGVSDDDLEALVRESFRFLLEREPASSILREFPLDEISRYFPEYPGDVARRLS